MNLKEYEIINLSKAFFVTTVNSVNRYHALDLEDAEPYIMHDDDLESLKKAKIGETIFFSHTRLIKLNGTYAYPVGTVKWVHKDNGSYLVKCDDSSEVLYRFTD